jgi:Ca2+:H+ antiporter
MIPVEELRAAATSEAAATGSPVVGTEHLLLAWLKLSSSPAVDTFVAGGVTPDSFAAMISGGRRAPAVPNGVPGSLSSHAQRALTAADQSARDGGRADADADDVLLAMTREPRGAIARALTQAKVKPTQLRALLRPGEQPARAAKASTPTKDVPSRRIEAATPSARRSPPVHDVEVDHIPEARAPARPRLEPPARPGSPPSPARRWQWLWLLFLAIPASIVCRFASGNAIAIFVTSGIAIIPLAALLARATEHLARRTTPMIGAVVSAAFGNAPEVIVAIAALNAGYLDLVKASIAGSILGNLLLLLGLVLITAGRKSNTVRFNRTTAGMSSTMLALAVAALLLPSILRGTAAERHLTDLSRLVAVLLVVVYLASLWFSMRTHRPVVPAPHDRPPERPWPMGVALVTLAVATALIAVESDLLVDTIVPVTQRLGLTQTFVGLILLPLIGNAAESATALRATLRGRTELGLQVALSSSTQVALLVAPLLVLLGAALGRSMTLVFPLFEVGALAVAVLVSAFITLDGESHWLEGLQLVALYGMIAVAAWFI